MSLISFIKEAGEKLFSKKDIEVATQAPAGSTQAESLDALNKKAAESIVSYIKSVGLEARALDVAFDGATATVNVYGVAATQAIREKIILAAGNVDGVAKVNDRMETDDPAPESGYYTVVKGDTLSKIAKSEYGDANSYMKIFEANKPMLKDPDKIYPGQVLRIPPKD